MGLHMTGSTLASLNNAFAGRWQATHAYLANDLVLAPDGTIIQRNSNGTSRGSYDSTEQAGWTVKTGASGVLILVDNDDGTATATGTPITDNNDGTAIIAA